MRKLITFFGMNVLYTYNNIIIEAMTTTYLINVFTRAHSFPCLYAFYPDYSRVR